MTPILCPYCGYDLTLLHYKEQPGRPGWSINPENGHTEYRCVCGNVVDET